MFHTLGLALGVAALCGATPADVILQPVSGK